MDLYADYHPHTILKGFGFANDEKAKSTLTLLNKRVAVRKKNEGKSTLEKSSSNNYV